MPVHAVLSIFRSCTESTQPHSPTLELFLNCLSFCMDDLGSRLSELALAPKLSRPSYPINFFLCRVYRCQRNLVSAVDRIRVQKSRLWIVAIILESQVHFFRVSRSFLRINATKIGRIQSCSLLCNINLCRKYKKIYF